MKLKGRIVVSFTVIMIIPLILIIVAFFTILKTKFSLIAESSSMDNMSIITAVANPISYVTKLTADDYNEIGLCLKNTPERFDNKEYMDKFSERVDKKYTYVYIIRNGKLIYGKNTELYNKIKSELLSYTYEMTDSNNYLENVGVQLMVRYLGDSDKKLNVFFVTSIMELEDESKQVWTQLFVSFIIIMFMTGLWLSYWLYRSIARPIDSLRNSAKRIIEGDLNTEIKHYGKDEIGDLYDDFDNMREHIKELLLDDVRKKKNMQEMVVNISHDLKTPLTAIKGYTEGLREGVANTPEKQDKYLSTIYTKTLEMTGLIEELTAYVKIDMDAVSYNFKVIDINEYMEDRFQKIKPDLEINHIDAYYHPYNGGKLEVIADAIHLRRVLNNLISNTKKYAAKDRRGRVDIRVSSAKEFVRIEIEDNGIGIPESSMSRIFDRLYRVDESRNSKIGGSGLGLAIVRKIIEDHDGKVWAESVEGKGTVMILLLRNAEFARVSDIEKKKHRTAE